VPHKNNSGLPDLARGIVTWFRANARDLPWRRTKEPYAIWISEVMLQQTRVKTVIPYWERWMAVFPNVQALAAAPDEQVLKCWEGLGYYARARNLQKAARLICEAHGGNFPRDYHEVLRLPGIGRYTAGAICSIAYGDAAPILDGNVVRVLARLFEMGHNPKDEIFWKRSGELLRAAARLDACSDLNEGLMELGATVCVPREPLCSSCPVKRRCGAYQSGRVPEFPKLPPKAKAVRREVTAFVFRSGDKVLVRKRADDAVNGGLWEFPNCEGEPRAAAQVKLRPLKVIRHTIMNSRITLRVRSGEVNGKAEILAREWNAQWVEIPNLERLPFSSAHARICRLLGDGANG
jgi:A/G-specific adenine glycosylase